MNRFILILSCPDRPGIVHAVSGALLEVDGNILENAQFDDLDSGLFTLRTRFETQRRGEEVRAMLDPIAGNLDATYRLREESAALSSSTDSA